MVVCRSWQGYFPALGLAAFRLPMAYVKMPRSMDLRGQTGTFQFGEVVELGFSQRGCFFGADAVQEGFGLVPETMWSFGFGQNSYSRQEAGTALNPAGFVLLGFFALDGFGADKLDVFLAGRAVGA